MEDEAGEDGGITPFQKALNAHSLDKDLLGIDTNGKCTILEDFYLGAEELQHERLHTIVIRMPAMISNPGICIAIGQFRNDEPSARSIPMPVFNRIDHAIVEEAWEVSASSRMTAGWRIHYRR